MNKVVGAVMAGVLASSSLTMPAEAISRAEIKSLSYGQIKGSGLANRCPVTEGKDSISGGKLKITELCIEPTSWQVEEVAQDKKGNMRKEFVNTKLMTRQTYTLEVGATTGLSLYLFPLSISLSISLYTFFFPSTFSPLLSLNQPIPRSTTGHLGYHGGQPADLQGGGWH